MRKQDYVQRSADSCAQFVFQVVGCLRTTRFQSMAGLISIAHTSVIEHQQGSRCQQMHELTQAM